MIFAKHQYVSIVHEMCMDFNSSSVNGDQTAVICAYTATPDIRPKFKWKFYLSPEINTTACVKAVRLAISLVFRMKLKTEVPCAWN